MVGHPGSPVSGLTGGPPGFASPTAYFITSPLTTPRNTPRSTPISRLLIDDPDYLSLIQNLLATDDLLLPEGCCIFLKQVAQYH